MFYRTSLLEALIKLFELPEDDTAPDDEHFIEVEDSAGKRRNDVTTACLQAVVLSLAQAVSISVKAIKPRILSWPMLPNKNQTHLKVKYQTPKCS
jgi:hypothetical protein